MESVNSSENEHFSKIVHSLPITKKTKVFTSIIIDNEEFLKFMKILSPDARYRFIEGLSTKQVNVLSQVFKQLLNRNMLRDENAFKFVRTFCKEIMEIGRKKTAIYKKKTFLKSTIGNKLLDEALQIALSALLILKNA